MSDGWTKELAAEHNDKYEREVERLREVGKRFLSEQEHVRAAKGFVGALTEMATTTSIDSTGATRLIKPARKPRAHPERDLQDSCEALLQLDGWRIFRMEQNYSERKRKVVGEPGVPDTLAIRYGKGVCDVPTDGSNDIALWIEWKSITGKPSQHQRLWHAAERARGALTWIAGQDFPATVDGFLEHYRSSGLMRRKL